MHKKTILLVGIFVTFLAGVGAIVYFLADTNLSNPPKGYCKVYEQNISIGDAPLRTEINDSMTAEISLTDVSSKAAKYFVTDAKSPQVNLFQDVSQLVGQDSKIWQDSLLLRTTGITENGTKLLLAKKCN